MNNLKRKVLFVLLILIVGSIYYYIELPALNIHSAGFWGFAIVICLISALSFIITGLKDVTIQQPFSFKQLQITGMRKTFSMIFGGAAAVLFVIFLIGSILSSQIVNASKYRQLIQISDGDFNKDIKQISYSEIPVLDKDSATIIGNRKMGTLVEYVSQFEVSSDYTQVNYKNKPVRVTPLQYGNWMKWLSNQGSGIPAYIRIDMATQDAQCIKLKEGMKYTEADHFNRNIHRYLRFHFPTYIFSELNFEIDEDGTPVYICPVKDFTIGLFGGETISSVVIVNAINGDIKEYATKDVPDWVDRVYSADLLVSYYNYYGSLKHGYWNSILSQKDCLKTTAGYNYIALDNDIWVYTGVTSVGKDQSNVGFVLMNQRTGATRYYPISGAEEYSAMSSAEGKVQHLKYKATFPLLLNIAGTPTYFICLKDSAGLVKQYAMVNIEKYTIVAIGDTVTDCEKNYITQIKANTSATNTGNGAIAPTISGKIAQITQAVVSGNSHFYILLEGNQDIFDVSVADALNIIRYKVGDTISFEYTKDDKSNIVIGIK